MNKIVKKYTDPSNPGSFQGISGFVKNNRDVKKSEATKSLNKLEATTLHKPIKSKFNRIKTLVGKIDQQWQVDLVDMTNLAGSNSNHKYILTVIDVFSKYAWAESLLNKTSENVKNAFEKIFKSGRKPQMIYADSGNEFKGSCKKYLEDLGITIYLARTKVKASVVERFNRTLKEKMFRYFTFNKELNKGKTFTGNNFHNKRYLEILPKMIKSYNNSYHRSIKMKPIEVNINNQDEVFENLFKYNINSAQDIYKKIIKLKFKKGDYVRIIKEKSIFEKGYTPNWSQKIYIISSVIISNPPIYSIKEITNNSTKNVEGYWYTEELQLVDLPFDTLEIHKEYSDSYLVSKLNSNDNQKQYLIDKNGLEKTSLTDAIATRTRSKRS
jgi:hypothetical protein